MYINSKERSEKHCGQLVFNLVHGKITYEWRTDVKLVLRSDIRVRRSDMQMVYR